MIANGHMYIVKGDITRLQCNAWLLPTGIEPSGSEYGHTNWELPKHIGNRPATKGSLVERGLNTGERIWRLCDATPSSNKLGESAGRPAIWAAHSGEDGHQDDPAW